MKEFFTLLIAAIKESDSSLVVAVWGICGGILLAVVVSLIARTSSHRLVSAVMRAGAVDRASAKSLGELGLKKAPFVKLWSRDGSAVMKYLSKTTDENGVERLYLTEEKRIGAELRFSRERHPIVSFILAAVVLFAVAVAALYLIPDLVNAYSGIGG